jgi:predicted TIM-barrel fold metal-dependent hydrolase
MEEFRDVRLVLYHSYPMIDAIAIAATHPNVYVENSWVADNPEFVLTAVRTLGSKRVLYGTDAPVSFGWHPGQPLPEDKRFFTQRMEYIGALPLSQEQKEDIMFRNAQRLFKIGKRK